MGPEGFLGPIWVCRVSRIPIGFSGFIGFSGTNMGLYGFLGPIWT